MILGICGFAGSGKGTVADILVKDYLFTKISFADTLKDTCSVLFGWDRKLLEGDTEESRKFRECPDPFWSEKFGKDVTPRWALQYLGTEVGRNMLHEEFWVLTLEHKLKTLPAGTNVVIPDVRFPNEIDFIRKKEGKVVSVSRGKDPVWADILANPFLGMDEKSFMNIYHPKIHYSEWAWIGQNINCNIKNDGTLDDLKEETDKVLTLFNVMI